MTQPDRTNRELFHRGHYNILAKQIRLALEPVMRYGINEVEAGGRMKMIAFAVSLARRLQVDNERFDPLIFLNACSPDPERYPLAELWSEEGDTHSVRA